MNLTVYGRLIDDSRSPIALDSGKELVRRISLSDFGTPAVALVLEAKTDDGRTVRIEIPNDPFNRVRAVVEP
jgi:hypothetical protein